MKLIFPSLLVLLFGVSCQETQEDTAQAASLAMVEEAVVIDSVEVLKSDLKLNQVEGIWYYKNEPYSGYALRFYSNDTLAESLGFNEGKREGVARTWSEQGVLRTQSYYKHNRLEGVYESWWENGNLAAQTNYEKGVKQGVEKEWYQSGERSKIRQLLDGKEDGMQKAWLPNGKLYVNYEAKNGRIFGMRRANSCYTLKDEVIQRYEKL
jgi:antitoxin component YwqK of YwqJK toxin-antitoxin module